MNLPVPRVLQGTPWEQWLIQAPSIAASPDIDAFQSEVMRWLADTPGHNAVPSDQEAAALVAWLTQFEVDLLDVKIGEVELPEVPLLYAVLSLIAACAGTSIAITLGVAAGAVAAAAVGTSLALVSAAIAAWTLVKASRKARNNRILGRVRKGLKAVKGRFWS